MGAVLHEAADLMISAGIAVCLKPVAEALSALGVNYEIGGSLASSAYGIARATTGIDIVADLRAEHVEPLIQSLQAAYSVDDKAARDAVRARSSFNLIHQATMPKVDVFVMKDRPYDRSAMSRRRAEQPLDGDSTTVYFYAPENILLNKLACYRSGNETSDRQWADILGILKVQQGALDSDYLRRWAAELGVLDLLERARGESGSE